MPWPSPRNTGLRNRVLLKPTHGPMMTTSTSADAPSHCRRCFHGTCRRASTIGIRTKGASMNSSARAIAPRPMAAARATARHRLGARHNRYAIQMLRVAVKIDIVSLVSTPSCEKTFGYTAAKNAAMRPARRPAISRPASPTSTIVAAPRTALQIMCSTGVRNPSTVGTHR